jgi:spore coat protein A
VLSRRKVLAIGGVVSGATLAGVFRSAQGADVSYDEHHGMVMPRSQPWREVTDAPVTPFTVPMPVPSVLSPTASHDGTDFYRIAIRTANAEIIPGLKTPVITFGGSFVGPTICARVGRRVSVTYDNRLSEAANVHLHGGHTPSASDGFSMDFIDPGTQRVYEYPNLQRGATLWYHDHAMGYEDTHVYRGMHGFYLLDDPAERRFNLPDGAYDVPIMIRDAQIDTTGEMIKQDPDARRVLIANGKAQPYFQVAARKYRLRLLNGSIYRFLTLSLDGAEMIQIGSDGGLLPAPLSRTVLPMSPAERAEIVVDFSRYPIGTKLVLSDTIGPVMRFDVTHHAADQSHVPDTLVPLPSLPAATVTRDFALSMDPDNPAHYINGRTFDPDRVDVSVRRGATEIWRVTNKDTDFGGEPGVTLDHNFHMHLVQFRVLDRDGKPPLPGESGLKDTVPVRPGETVRLQATFSDCPGRYLYHCHMIEHSAYGMMGRYDVV